MVLSMRNSTCSFIHFSSFLVIILFRPNLASEAFSGDQHLSASPLHAAGEAVPQPPKQQEPNIDLELDVKVFINSGKCVLHTRDAVRDEEIKL